MTKEEYINFMYDAHNIHQCENCPENAGVDPQDGDNRNPCGQFNCWVSVLCREAKKAASRD